MKLIGMATAMDDVNRQQQQNTEASPILFSREPHRSRLRLRYDRGPLSRGSKPRLPVPETRSALRSPSPRGPARVDRDGVFRPTGDMHYNTRNAVLAAVVGSFGYEYWNSGNYLVECGSFGWCTQDSTVREDVFLALNLAPEAEAATAGYDRIGGPCCHK